MPQAGKTSPAATAKNTGKLISQLRYCPQMFLKDMLFPVSRLSLSHMRKKCSIALVSG
jgi:hypothetical protein